MLHAFFLILIIKLCQYIFLTGCQVKTSRTYIERKENFAVYLFPFFGALRVFF